MTRSLFSSRVRRPSRRFAPGNVRPLERRALLSGIQPPTAPGGTIASIHDHDATGAFYATDPQGLPVTYSVVTQPAVGSLSFNNGWADFKPPAHWIGTASFTYTASNGQATSAPATVNIAVTDNAPVASPVSFSGLHDRAINGYFQATDPDGDTLGYGFSQPANGTGTVTYNGGGSFTYTPPAHWTGTATFTYTASDGILASNQGTVTINVTDRAPVASNTTTSTLHDRAVNGYLQATDPDGDPIGYAIVSQPANGSVIYNGGGSYTYTPPAHWYGQTSFTYLASDGVLSSNVTTVTINVTDQAPVASNVTLSTLHDHGTSGAFYATDPDPDTLGYGFTQPAAGTGTVTSQVNGGFTYTPPAHWVGTATFTYTASDGILSSSATVTVNVTDRAPVANSLAVSGLHDHPITGYLQASDPDGDPLTFSTYGSPAGVVLNGSTFTYTPPAYWTGTTSFQYAAYDGILYSDIKTVTITVTDRAPVVSNATLSVVHDRVLYASLGSYASDPDGDVLTFSPTATVTQGAAVLLPTGQLNYIPPAHWVGTVSIPYAVSDGILSTNATLTINVTDQAPQIANQTFTVGAPGNLYGAVQASDPDGDSLTYSVTQQPAGGTVQFTSGSNFTYTPATVPAPTFTQSGNTYSYTQLPSPATTPQDSFTVKVSDSIYYATAVMTVNVPRVVSGSGGFQFWSPWPGILDNNMAWTSLSATTFDGKTFNGPPQVPPLVHAEQTPWEEDVLNNGGNPTAFSQTVNGSSVSGYTLNAADSWDINAAEFLNWAAGNPIPDWVTTCFRAHTTMSIECSIQITIRADGYVNVTVTNTSNASGPLNGTALFNNPND